MTTERSNFTSRSNWLLCLWEIRNKKGYRVLAQSSASAQRLLAAGFTSMPIEYQGSDPEMGNGPIAPEVILDASVRRFQAHKNLSSRCGRERDGSSIATSSFHVHSRGHSSQLREIDQLLRQELDSITDHTIFSDLRQADLRAGLWGV